MIKDVSFCTCTDTACPMHPSNHNDGCTRCVAKNLARGEIPSCFFKKTGKPKKGDGWHFEDFVKTMLGE